MRSMTDPSLSVRAANAPEHCEYISFRGFCQPPNRRVLFLSAAARPSHKSSFRFILFTMCRALCTRFHIRHLQYARFIIMAYQADYVHICMNNTIYGTELRQDPDSPIPLVADMSSDIFSRKIDVSKYNIIYAGAQKNLAPSGVTIVIVKTEALGNVERAIPTMLNYRTHIDKGSMFNTPPCLPIYSALQTLKWYKAQGGVDAMEKLDKLKAAKLYDAIDSSKIFVGTAKPEDRSIMNVCFVMKPEYAELEKQFIEFATANNIVGIKGHRSVGGFRASIYNAMPLESVETLINVMKEFENKI